MTPESNSLPQFSDYPVNLFEESRDHANQWDVSTLWLPLPQVREEENPTRTEQA